MIIIDEDRPSDSPFVERIWRAHSEGASPFLSIADSRSEMVGTRHHGKLTLTMRGPETKATPLGDCPADSEGLGIGLTPGDFLRPLPARNRLDANVRLRHPTRQSFRLVRSHCQSP